MANTVIGFFEDASDAQKAVEKLQSIGIGRQKVDIRTGRSDENVSTGNRDRSDDDDNGITRFFKSLFGSDNDDADRYSRVGQQSTIVTVHTDSGDQAERAADILDEYGAFDVDEKAARFSGSGNSSRQGDLTIPVVKENLEVGKRTEERGGVRVRSRIVEKPVEEHVRLREENVHVERKAVNRPASSEDLEGFREGEIEMTEKSEVPVVKKEARVVEEVKVRTDVTERDETIRETLRDTDVDVNEFDRNKNQKKGR